MIELKNVTVKYLDKPKQDAVLGLDSFSATFSDDSINVIVGPSGAGKSTLLKVLAGFINYSGELLIDGNDASTIRTAQRNISVVTQTYTLYPHMNVFDNIAYPLKLIKCTREDIIQRVNSVAKEFGLSLLLTRLPRHLSGGQQQRVAISKALVKNPSFFLFDEPFSNVDPVARREERRFVRDVLKKYRATAVYVTHDMQEALMMADKIFVLNEGKLEIAGTPSEILGSNNKVVKELFKSLNE